MEEPRAPSVASAKNQVWPLKYNLLCNNWDYYSSTQQNDTSCLYVATEATYGSDSSTKPLCQLKKPFSKWFYYLQKAERKLWVSDHTSPQLLLISEVMLMLPYLILLTIISSKVISVTGNLWEYKMGERRQHIFILTINLTAANLLASLTSSSAPWMNSFFV